MISIKRILYLFAIIALLAMSPGGSADQANFPDIYIDGASGGDGSLATPYSDFASINWTTGGDNSVFDAVAADKDVTINLKKGVTWREQMTVGASGSAAHPVTIQAYGEGADPIINGADLVETWTEAGNAFQNSWTAILDADSNTTKHYNDRNLIDADTSTVSGNTIRLTFTGDSGVEGQIDGCSIGLRDSTSEDYDGAPTRVTFSGNNYGTLPANGTLVSDEITFNFDHTLDYLQHSWWDKDHCARRSTSSGSDGAWTLNDVDQNDTLTENISGYDTKEGDSRALSKVEVRTVLTNVWQATLTSEPTRVYFNDTRGNKQTIIDDVDSENDWYWAGNVLYVYYTEDPDGAIIIEASTKGNGIKLDNNDYITIQDIKVDKPKRQGIYAINGCSGLIISRVTVEECGSEYVDGAIEINDSSAPTITNCNTTNNSGQGILIDDCNGATITGGTHTGNGWDYDSGPVYCAITVGGTSDCEDSEVDGCTITANYGGGIFIDPVCNGTILSNNIIHENGLGVITYAGIIVEGTDGFTLDANSVYQEPKYGIVIDSALNGVVQRNDIYGNTDIALFFHDSSGNDYGRGENATVDSCVVRYNTVRDNTLRGVVGFGLNASLFYYNLIYGNGGYGLDLIDGNNPACTDNEFYNNIFYANTTNNIYVRTTGNNDNSGNIFKNNISIGSTYQLRFEANQIADSVVTHNAFGTEAASFIRWGGVTYATYDLWETAYGGTTYSIEVAPLMTDPSSDDFTLQIGSPCINRGTFVGLLLDYLGLPVPIGHRPDIGAYEHKNGGAVIH